MGSAGEEHVPSSVLGLVRPSCTTGLSKMAWKRGLLGSMPLSSSSGEGFRSPSSHSHCKQKRSRQPWTVTTQQAPR